MDEYGCSNIYLIPKGFKDINPVDCGWEKCRPNHAYGPAIREYYLIHYVKSGSGTFKNERGEYSVTAGQLFVIRPGEVTYYKASEDDPWKYSWIGFTGEIASVFDSAPDVITADCQSHFEAMQKYIELDYMREEALAGQSILLIADLFGEKNGGKNSSGFAARAANYISVHYMYSISVESISDKLNVDRRYLSRLFKREYGVTVQEFILSTRMKHAAEFLENGYSVTQSANMSGYTDVFNFSKMFKRYYGVTPSKLKGKGKINA